MSDKEIQNEASELIKSTPLSKEDYARIVKQSFSHYIIFENKIGMAYCTSCNSRIRSKRTYTHNEEGKCPRCHKDVIYKSKGKFTLLEHKYIITFHRKSENKIVAVTRLFERAYQKEMWDEIIGGESDLFISHEPYAAYIFVKDKPVTAYRMTYYQHWWIKEEKVYCDRFYNCATEVIADTYKLSSIIMKTWLKYMYQTILNRRLTGIDRLKGIEVMNKYPNLEKLEKVGLGEIIIRKVWDKKSYRSINWNGKTLLEILKLENKRELRLLLNQEENTNHITAIRLIQMARKEGWYISADEIKKYIYIFDPERFSGSYKKVGLRKFIAYQKKQKKIRSGWDFHNMHSDYLRQAKELGYDINDESIYLPSNLQREHDRVSAEYGEMKDKIAAEKRKHESQKIQEVYNSLICLEKESEKYIIRAVRDLEELLKEGRELHHCVASYADKITKKKSWIWLVRKVEEPETQFFTAETSTKGVLLQLRGKYNCTPPEDVNEFVKSWSKDIKQKIKKGRTKNARKQATETDLQHLQMV